jgi:hypothetical protein
MLMPWGTSYRTGWAPASGTLSQLAEAPRSFCAPGDRRTLLTCATGSRYAERPATKRGHTERREPYVSQSASDVCGAQPADLLDVAAHSDIVVVAAKLSPEARD